MEVWEVYEGGWICKWLPTWTGADGGVYVGRGGGGPYFKKTSRLPWMRALWSMPLLGVLNMCLRRSWSWQERWWTSKIAAGTSRPGSFGSQAAVRNRGCRPV